MRKISRKRRRIAGFTLVEVLAVATIVASMPQHSYERAKKKARQTESIHNLKQLSQLLQMYVMENGHYPKAAFYPRDPRNGSDSIRQIVGGPEKLWVCPNLPDELQKRGLTFVYNDTLAGKSNIRNPAKKWVLIDMSCVSSKVPPPHPNGYNILFADGHIITSKRLPKRITEAWDKQ